MKRGAAIDERVSNRSMPDPRAHENALRAREVLLEGLERAFDRRQVEGGLPTIALRRQELAAAEAAGKLADDEVPVAMGMLMLPRARAKAMEARAELAARQVRAARLRKIAQMELQLFLNQVKRAADVSAAEDAAAASAAVAREADERALILRELRELSPALIALGAGADRERIGQAARGFIEAEAAPRDESDLDAEREALRRLLRKSG